LPYEIGRIFIFLREGAVVLFVLACLLTSLLNRRMHHRSEQPVNDPTRFPTI
jgi:hypothetical protein